MSNPAVANNPVAIQPKILNAPTNEEGPSGSQRADAGDEKKLRPAPGLSTATMVVEEETAEQARCAAAARWTQSPHTWPPI